MPLKASATRGSGSSYWPKPDPRGAPLPPGLLAQPPTGKGWRDPRSPHSHARVPRSGMWWTTSADNKQELTQLRIQHFISVLTAWLHPKTQKIKTPWTHGCPLNLSHLRKPQVVPAGTVVPEQCEGCSPSLSRACPQVKDGRRFCHLRWLSVTPSAEKLVEDIFMWMSFRWSCSTGDLHNEGFYLLAWHQGLSCYKDLRYQQVDGNYFWNGLPWWFRW